MKKQILAGIVFAISFSAAAAKKPAAPVTIGLLSKGKAGRAFEYSKSCSAVKDMSFAQQGVHVVAGQKLVIREPLMCQDEGKKKSKAKNCVCSCAPNEDATLLSDADQQPMAACLSLIGGKTTASNAPKIPPSRFQR